MTPDDLPTEAELAAIYQQYSGLLHTYAYHLLGNQEDADDIIQEVFIRAYSRLGQLRDQASLRSWLYRITSNLCMDHLRRRARAKRALGVELSLGAEAYDDGPAYEIASPAAPSAFEGIAERDHISQALRRIPHKYAMCLLLHSLQGLSYHEIADVLGITSGAAAVRLTRARDLFARAYEAVRKEETL